MPRLTVELQVKWLVPDNMNVIQLATVVKQRLQLRRDKEFFLMVDGTIIPPQTLPMDKLREMFADPDGFLYFTYSSQESFG